VTKDKKQAVLYVYNNGKGALGGPNAIEENNMNFNMKGKIKLKGLLRDTVYVLKIAGDIFKAKGSYLMKTGITLKVSKPQDAVIIRINKKSILIDY